MSSYALLVAVHVAAAVALLATSIVGEPAVRAAVRRATDVRDLRAYLEIGRPMAMISPPAAMVLLASGIYLVSVADFWALGWVQVALAFWAVNLAVALVLVRRAVHRVETLAVSAAEPSIDAELDAARWSPAWTRGADLLAANDAAVLLLMSLKPGLGGSLLLVIVVNVTVTLGRTAFGGRPLGMEAVPAAAASAPGPPA